MLFILIFVLCHWYLSLFTLTFLQHRYASHAVFSMSKPWERFFYLLAYIAQGSAYVSPRTFAILHRMHHAYTDTEKDPHSPLFDKNLFTLMWNTRAFSTSIFNGSFKAEARFQKNLPDWASLDNWAHSWMSRIGWMAVYAVLYILFAPSLWWLLLLPFHILTVPIAAVVINWVAHKFGTVNYKMNNTSKNLWPFDFIMLGEAYHNNHHKYPASPNMGRKWYEVDPVYPIILLLHKLRVIRINKQQANQEN